MTSHLKTRVSTCESAQSCSVELGRRSTLGWFVAAFLLFSALTLGRCRFRVIQERTANDPQQRLFTLVLVGAGRGCQVRLYVSHTFMSQSFAKSVSFKVSFFEGCRRQRGCYVSNCLPDLALPLIHTLTPRWFRSAIRIVSRRKMWASSPFLSMMWCSPSRSTSAAETLARYCMARESND